ncbi:MAG: PP2C family protein-serine/threonine phosphatase [Phycisphaerales bacterium]
MPAAAQHTMQCLEVWGGNQAVDNGVVMPGLDAWVYSRPYKGEAAGGDIHYVSSCASGRITRLLVADVSGHGQSVARVATGLRDLMRRYVNYVDMGRFVGGLNREFAALSDADGGVAGGFATAVIATYWVPTDYLTLCNAGHPRPLWYRARRRAWSFLENSEANRAEGLANIPLGIAEPTRYDQIGVRLEPGDLVLVYTDSLIEAKDAAGRMIGQAGLLAIASKLDPTDPRRLITNLLDAVQSSGAEPPHDDVTVLALRPNALKPRASLVEGIRTTARLARAFAASLLPGGQRFPWPQRGADNILGAFFKRWNRRPGG